MSQAFSNAARRLGVRAGTTSIEFALVAVMFLFLLIATWDVARYLFMVQSMQLLADQAVRASTLPVRSPGYLSPQGCGGVPGSLPFTPPPFLDPATLLCVVLSNSPTTGANVATVTVEAPFNALTPGLSALTAAGGSLVTVGAQLQYPAY